MRHSNRNDKKLPAFKQKQLARRKYGERQIDKWVKWTWEIRGRVKYKELVEYQNKYNIKVYG